MEKGTRKGIRLPAWNRLNPILFVLAGTVFWGLSLPYGGTHGIRPSLGILAVAAFACWMLVAAVRGARSAAAWGWSAGFLMEMATMWWLVPTLVRYGEMSRITALLLVIGMCLVLGLYMALFLGTLSWLYGRRGPSAYVLAPFLWVLVEWLRGHLFTGLPWWGPGYALSLYADLLQSARFLGVLGLSLFCLAASAALVLWVTARRSMLTLTWCLLTFAAFASAYVDGMRFRDPGVDRDSLFAVGFLQPNVRQDQKWSIDEAGRIRRRLLKLSKAYRGYPLKLLVWPETCTPDSWDQDEAFRKEVAGAAAHIDSPILLGSVLKAGGEGEWSNGAVLVLPSGQEGGRYAKTHLVPFGETVPLREFLPVIEPLVHSVGEWRAGESLAPLEFCEGSLGVSICYEGIFPSLVARQVDLGARLLVNITNDAWYEGTPGPAQHFLMQRVRSVETRRYLIRSANGGYSGVVTPWGRLDSAIAPDREAAWWGEVGMRSERTVYVRIGERWLWICLLLVLVSAILPGAPEGGVSRARGERSAE